MTHITIKYQLYPFWDDEYKRLDYIREPFNDPVSVAQWVAQGYPQKFEGELCDMRHRLPEWSKRFIEIFEGQGWQDIGLAFYRMPTGTVMQDCLTMPSISDQGQTCAMVSGTGSGVFWLPLISHRPCMWCSCMKRWKHSAISTTTAHFSFLKSTAVVASAWPR